MSLKENAGAGFFLFAAGAALFLAAACWRLGDFLFLDPDTFCCATGALRFAALLSCGPGPETVSEGLVPGLSLSPYLMYGPYTGLFPVYAAAVFILFLKPVAGAFLAFKIMHVFFGFMALVFIFLVLGRSIGRLPAGLAVFFLGTNWSYIASARRSFVREEMFQIAGLWFGLWILGGPGRRRLRLCLAAFVWGLALWAKIMFLGYIVAVAAALAALGPDGRRRIRAQFALSGKNVFAACAAFAAGASPLIAFNLLHSFPTLRVLGGAMAGGGHSLYQGRWVWDNRDILLNLGRRAEDLYSYLGGGMGGGGGGWPVFPVFAVIGLCFALFVVFFGRKTEERGFFRFWLAGYGALFVLSCFLLGFHYPGHVLILTPVFEVLAACAAVRLCLILPGRGLGAAVLFAVAALWFGSQAQSANTFFARARALEFPYVLPMSAVRAVAGELDAQLRPQVVSFSCNAWMIKFFAPGARMLVLPDGAEGMESVFLRLRKNWDGRAYAFVSWELPQDRAFVAGLRAHGFEIADEFVLRGGGRKNETGFSLCRLARRGVWSGTDA